MENAGLIQKRKSALPKFKLLCSLFQQKVVLIVLTTVHGYDKPKEINCKAGEELGGGGGGVMEGERTDGQKS